MHKRIAALILCSIALLSALSVWAITNTQNSTPNQKDISGDKAANVNFVPNKGAPSIIVPDDYPNISSAVQHASSGDVILVKQGTYVESVTVDKPITLQAQNTQTVVDGNNFGPSFYVTSDNVTITGFTVRNVENAPPPSDSIYQLAGIHLLSVHNCRISGNVVVNCGKGVWIYGGSANVVANNTFLGNNYGLLVDSSQNDTITDNVASNGWNGILLMDSQDNTLKSNDMHSNIVNFGVTSENPTLYLNNVDASNTVEGKKIYYLIGENGSTISSTTYPDLGALILVDCKDVTVQNLEVSNSYGGIHLVNTDNSTVTNNNISNNYEGVWIQFSNNCTIYNNQATQNSDMGISVEESTNIIVLNNNIEQNYSTFINILNSPNCNIEGNSIQNTGTTLPNGILLQSSNECNIIDNSQVANTGVISAIDLENSSNNLVQLNDFESCETGIIIYGESNYNNINNNTFSTEGGYFGVHLVESYFNNLTENVVNNFSNGLQLEDASNNNLARNIVTSRVHAAVIDKFNNNIFDSNVFLGATDFWDLGAQVSNSPSVNTWIENGTVTYH